MRVLNVSFRTWTYCRLLRMRQIFTKKSAETCAVSVMSDVWRVDSCGMLCRPLHVVVVSGICPFYEGCWALSSAQFHQVDGGDPSGGW